MKLTFNTASLAKLSKSELYALLAEYRSKLDHAGESERPAIKAAISSIETELAHMHGPG